MNRPEAKKKRIGKQSIDAAEQTKRDILEASLHCFATKGYTSTTLRDIAEQAHTTHGLIRHHFGSKENLWKRCTSYVVDQVAQVQLPLLSQVSPENAVESFQAVIRTMIYNAAKYPDLWRLLTFEALKDSERLDYLLNMVRPIHDKITPLFKLVQSQGYFSDFNNDNFFLFIVSLGAMPFAMSPFSNKVCNVDILSEAQIQAHADLVIDTLFRVSTK